MAHFLHEGYMPRVSCFYTETTAEEGRGFRPIGQELTEVPPIVCTGFHLKEAYEFFPCALLSANTFLTACSDLGCQEWTP